jgi:hypothetical protein
VKNLKLNSHKINSQIKVGDESISKVNSLDFQSLIRSQIAMMISESIVDKLGLKIEEVEGGLLFSVSGYIFSSTELKQLIDYLRIDNEST